MSKTANTALMQAQSIAAPQPGAANEWVHLLPAGEIATNDARGPYRVPDAAALIAASMHGADRLPIDENHAIDLAAPRGEASPARGWIVEMQARADGIWGRVEWTATGTALMAERAYSGISPVIQHDKAGNILRILRASLVNRPNLRGMTALQQETEMDFLKRLAKALGLGEDATEDAVIERVTSLAKSDGKPELQSALSEIGVALGVADGATPDAVLNAAKASAGGQAAITALQSELAGVVAELNEVKGATSLQAATAFVDGAIKDGHVGVKPLRDHYIAMHQADPARVEKEIGAMPKLGATDALERAPVAVGESQIALNAAQRDAAVALGLSLEDYAQTLAAEQAQQGGAL